MCLDLSVLITIGALDLHNIPGTCLMDITFDREVWKSSENSFNFMKKMLYEQCAAVASLVWKFS